ncbi:MAG: TetR/AcrR family transcriptional regulator [Acidimicrobiales bacterium]
MPKLAEETKAGRRADILAAALACFAQGGYHGTTMSEVAEAAEVSKGTPYLYFPSKEELFIALHDEWNCGLGDRIGSAVGALSDDERNSPRRVLLAVALAVGSHAVERSDTCRVLMEIRTLAGYQPQIAAAVEASEERNRRQLRELFQAGIAAGEWPSDTDPNLATLVFTAGLYGLMAQWHLRPGSFSWEAAAASLVGGIAGTGARRLSRADRLEPSPASADRYAATDERKLR